MNLGINKEVCEEVENFLLLPHLICFQRGRGSTFWNLVCSVQVKIFQILSWHCYLTIHRSLSCMQLPHGGHLYPQLTSTGWYAQPITLPPLKAISILLFSGLVLHGDGGHLSNSVMTWLSLILEGVLIFIRWNHKSQVP